MGSRVGGGPALVGLHVEHARLLESARGATVVFVERASTAADPREAADWALAAKNMAACFHSLMGAAATARRPV